MTFLVTERKYWFYDESHTGKQICMERMPNGIEMRRSQRVLLRMPIQVRWTPQGDAAITEDTTTLVVNAHGALILLAMRVKAGVRLFVRNAGLMEDKECRVVRVEERLEGKSKVGVEFLRPDAKFWGLEFPPEDWKVG